MAQYKRNQVEDAIFRTLAANDARRNELRLRLQRLLVTDRRLGIDARSDEEDRRYAFYSQKPPGSGTEIMFSEYESFALLAAIMLLEHGLPQATVVRVMRRIRKQFEIAHRETMKKDPSQLFDAKAILAQAKPGMIATDNTDPVFLMLVGLTGSSVDPRGSAVAVCQGHNELGTFFGKHSGRGATFFEFVRAMHTLASHLLKTRPVKRGR